MGNPVFARVYSNLIVKGLERGEGPDLRRRVLAGTTGTVVEVGAGDGANFRYYPESVERVVAVEPEAYLRERARRAAVLAGGRFEVIEGDAAALPLEDASVDAVVFCLVLCSVPDVPAALAEAHRVLRPAGQVRFLEHVESPQPGFTRRAQHALDATVWPHLFGGCHTGRDAVGALERAGFAVVELERFTVPEGSRLPMSPAVIGSAVPEPVLRADRYDGRRP